MLLSDGHEHVGGCLWLFRILALECASTALESLRSLVAKSLAYSGLGNFPCV